MARRIVKKTSGVIQPVAQATQNRLTKEFRELQEYWSRIAREKGILTERDLEKFLKD
jgi:hypothetical protein